MLSRTADSLYWMSRYSERAANVARAVGVTWRMANLASSLGADEQEKTNEWSALLTAMGQDGGYFEKHNEVAQDVVIRFLVHDPHNFSGIVASIEAARRNGRAVRTALTIDMWEALNDTWNQLRGRAEQAQGEHLPLFLEWVRERSLLFAGAAEATMLRDEAWHFMELGQLLERADNTARLLDVRHELVGEPFDSAVNHARWQSVLSSVSGLRAYQWVYHQSLQPRLIADLLILRPELPRSLMACHMRVAALLEEIAEGQGGRRGECHRLAGALASRLRYTRIETILHDGLHAFLTDMIEATSAIGREVEAFYIRG